MPLGTSAPLHLPLFARSLPFCKNSPAVEKSKVRELFDSIATRYDLANDILSFGYHRVWERRAVRALDLRPGMILLDLGAGSGRITARVLAAQPRLKHALLVDLSEQMLRIAQRSLARWPVVQCVSGDGEALPLRDEAMDAAILAYCLRNIPDRSLAIEQLGRVLRSGGRLVILEFSAPASRWFAPIYFFYLCRIIPIIGGLVTGHPEAYVHLRDSIGEFPSVNATRLMLEDSGFRVIETCPLSLGVATLYVAVRE
jgi:demethylmenaquinone methyltransferase/2-methoxy-6-polyprenyl-1,4-benzoquinol methylase